MRRTLSVLILVLGCLFAMNSYASIFSCKDYPGLPGCSSSGAKDSMGGIANGIAGSFNPGTVHMGGSNGQMNGGGTSNGNPTHNFNSHKGFFQPSANDSSINYLGYIFGNVGNMLNGEGVPLLGQIFNLFNTAIMGLGVIVITYLVFRGILDTAAHGEFLGKQMNSVWVPVRAVLGVLLLIPRKGGYCVAQLIMMYVIIMGVGAADTVWNKALTYFQNGGAMSPISWQSGTADWNNNQSGADANQHKKDSAAYAQQIEKVQAMVGQVFQSLVCMQSFAQHKDGPAFVAPLVQLKPGEGRYDFIAKTNIKSSPTFNCGSVSWTVGTETGGAATAAMQNIVSVLTQSAHDVVITPSNTPDGGGNQIKYADPKRQQAVFSLIGSNVVEKLAYSYQGALENAATSSTKPENQDNQFMDNARNLGWIYAGAYFHNIIELENKAIYVPIPNVTGADPFYSKYNYNFTNERTDYFFTQNFVSSLEQVSQSDGPVGGDSGAFLPAQGEHGSKQVCTTKTKGWWIFKSHHKTCHTEKTASAGDIIYSDISSAFQYLTNNTNVQPVLALQNVGLSLLHTIAATIAGVVDLNTEKTKIAEDGSTGSAVLSMIPFFGNPLSQMNNAVVQAQLSEMTSFQGLLIALATALMLPASTLAVYMPMLPYILFTVGALGWLLAVFEALVAAPIVSLGIVYPEGHDVYGKSQPAVMLIANVFLRPMLMVVGMIAAILISDAAVSLINAGFIPMVKSSYNFASIPNSNGTTLALLSVLLLFIYVATMLAVINKCFQLIYAIPDKVLRWLDNFVPSGQDEAQVVQEMKGEYTQNVNDGKQLGSKAMETSVSMNDAENKKTQETNQAWAGVAKAAVSGAGTAAGAKAVSDSGALDGLSFM